MENEEVAIDIQPSHSHDFVTFNNQNSVLMSKFIPDSKRLCLLHDNRIFAFEKAQPSKDNATSSNEQNLLLNIMTTARYRVMSAMYIIFRLLDNIILLYIILKCIKYGQLIIPTEDEIGLLAIIGVEVFYDVMLYTHKYWMLQRLSLYIGFVLYGFYYLIVAIRPLSDKYTQDDKQNVFIILTIRFLAFIFEECVDIAIDGQLHNDLLKLKEFKYENNINRNSGQNETNNEQNTDTVDNLNDNESLSGENSRSSQNSRQSEDIDRQNRDLNRDQDEENLISSENLLSSQNPDNSEQNEVQVENKSKFKRIKKWFKKTKQWFKNYMDIRVAVEIPDEVEYEGSFFAWSAYSVFTENVWKKDKFSGCLLFFLCFIPFGITILFIILIILPLCTLAFIIILVLVFPLTAICLCTCSINNIKAKLNFCDFLKELITSN